MRQRLLEAALDCLVDLGYARTTTTEIVKRAKVSRGALLHHYPSKDELMVSAMAYIADKRLREFRQSVKKLPKGPERLSEAIDLVWSHFSSPSFYAMLELAVAARTEANLHQRLIEAGERFEAQLTKTTQELFGQQIADKNLLNLGQVFIFYLMQGMATAHMSRDESQNIAGVTALLKQVIQQTLIL